MCNPFIFFFLSSACFQPSICSHFVVNICLFLYCSDNIQLVHLPGVQLKSGHVNIWIIMQIEPVGSEKKQPVILVGNLKMPNQSYKNKN